MSDDTHRTDESDSDWDHSDWYYDPMPGPIFARGLHALRQRGPVVSVKALGGALPVHYIVSHATLSEAFRDGTCFPPAHAYQIISQPFIGETFMSMDEAPHRVWRPAMTPAFRKTEVDRLEASLLEPIAHELIDRIESKGEADLVPTFTHLFAFGIICRQLGLPRDAEEAFYDWSMDLMFGGRDLEKSRAADAVLTSYIDPVIDARRREPEDDVISDWLRTEVEGNVVSREKILAHIRLFFTAGATTTSDALGNLVHALGTHPDAWHACIDEPVRCGDAVQELLRFNPPVAAQPRFSHPDHAVDFQGVRFEPNSAVLFGIAAANRDPAVHPDPDRFDIERRPENLMTFGPGLRTCPGMHLAQKNLRVALSVLTQRLPSLRLVEPEKHAPSGILLRGPKSLPARW